MAETQSTKWFEENVVDNREDLIKIGEFANEMLFKNISLGLTNAMTTISIYAKIFDVICDAVVDKEEEYSEFALNVAGRFTIGYTTTDNEDDEKSGNFMCFMNHIDEPHSDAPSDENESDTIQLCVQWNANNIKTQSEMLKDIRSKGKKQLSSLLNIKTESDEYIMPMFCIIHEAIVSYVKSKLIENEETMSEYEINVAGLYTIGAQMIEGVPSIYYVPTISLKLKFKNDAIATGSDE